ncbi:MAG: hypothetical protein WAW74_07970, partial [Trichococcus flocculiformis]
WLQSIGNTGLLSNSLSIKVFKIFYAFDIAIKLFKINGKIVNEKRKRTHARLRAYFVPDKGVFTCLIKKM